MYIFDLDIPLIKGWFQSRIEIKSCIFNPDYTVFIYVSHCDVSFNVLLLLWLFQQICTNIITYLNGLALP